MAKYLVSNVTVDGVTVDGVVNFTVSSNVTQPLYYNPSKDDCTLFARLIINTVIAGGICFLGLAGNALSFVILRKDKQTPVASFLLQTLAYADSLFLTLWFVHFSVNDIFEYAHIDQHSHRLWVYTRLYSYPFLFIGQTATIWLTVLIAATRFIAICMPYRAADLCNMVMVKKGVIATIVFSVVYNLPRFFDTKVVHIEQDMGNFTQEKYYFGLTELGESKVYANLYMDICYYIFSFGLPLLILAVLNTKLTIAYHRVQKRREHLRGMKDSSRDRSGSGGGHSDPNITLVMIIVVLIFMLCNLPARVVQIVWKYRDQACLTAEFFIKEVSSVMEVLNSSTNFIVYCAFRQQFRDNLRNTLCFSRLQSGHKDEESTRMILLNGMSKKGDPEPTAV